ncbi:hypothetical protein GCM10027418_01450 [Mariniluteicoccus endophyticus]
MCCAAVALVVALVVATAPPATATELPPLPRGRLPIIGGDVVRPFQPPAKRWLSGHRGVDVSGRAGQMVVAAADGEVAYAGTIAGRPVMAVVHGAVRTTYEPVSASVPVGTRVRAGQVIGVLEGGHCPTAVLHACLHLGLRLGDTYLDPMLLIGGGAGVRLLPGSAEVGVAERVRERAAPPPEPAGDGTYARGGHGAAIPGSGPVTSRFGMRLHPVLKVWKLHDGVDYGTGCGQPLRAIHDGVVEAAYFNAGYGNRLMVDHGVVDGHRVKSSYNHAIRWTASPGQRITKGQVIGLSGSTGYSTGCHLHFMLWIDGRLVDPLTWLG